VLLQFDLPRSKWMAWTRRLLLMVCWQNSKHHKTFCLCLRRSYPCVHQDLRPLVRSLQLAEALEIQHWTVASVDLSIADIESTCCQKVSCLRLWTLAGLRASQHNERLLRNSLHQSQNRFATCFCRNHMVVSSFVQVFHCHHMGCPKAYSNGC